MKKIAVVLSGCGVYDGAEIHEAVLTLLAIDRAGAKAVCIAPDIEQMHVIDHTTGQASAEKRNVLRESARIARGDIKNIADVKATDIDALVFPGGFGAAKNLCDFAVNGAKCSVHLDVSRLTKEMLKLKKPVGAACIAPALIAAIFKGSSISPSLTIGTDLETAKAIEAMGARHKNCQADEINVDTDNKIVSTPAYMSGKSIAEVSEGIDKMIKAVIDMT